MPKIPSVYALADEINEAAGKKVIRYAMRNVSAIYLGRRKLRDEDARDDRRFLPRPRGPSEEFA